MSNISDLIESFLDLDGAKWAHIVVQGDGGKAEMILPLSPTNPVPPAEEPTIEIVPMPQAEPTPEETQ